MPLKNKKTTSKSSSTDKPIGVVTHFYGNLKVAIIKFSKSVKVGTKIRIQGATTSFSQDIKSMQFDHEEIKTASPKKEVGIKVSKKVREGDKIYTD